MGPASTEPKRSVAQFHRRVKMTFSISELRLRTLKNNFTWLRSFGCSIRRSHRALRVDHPELPEYSAWLLPSPDPDPYQRLQTVLAEVRTGPSAPDIYIEESEPEILQLELLVRRADYERGPASVTKAALWMPNKAPPSLQVTRARRDRIDEWSALYSEGFGRAKRDRDVDRSRWRRAVLHPKLRFWFIEKAHGAIGICQTCHDFNVVGIYSLTLVPSHRGTGSVRLCMKTLKSHLAAAGEVIVYFERVKPLRRSAESSSLISARPTTVRGWQSYSHVHRRRHALTPPKQS